MKFLKLNDWLKLFKIKNISFQEFLKVTKIINSNNDFLRLKITDNDTRRLLYNAFVKNIKQYLTNFYNTSLKIPNDLDLNNLKVLTMSNTRNKNKKNLIRNLYYKELLLLTQTDLRNVRPFLEVLLDLTNKLIIDYKLVTPSGLKHIRNNNFSNILSAYYFRSSIMNPAIPFILSKKYLKGSRVFTPTLGWSSYLYGFLSNENVKEYVGTDVIPKVCRTSRQLAKKIFPLKNTIIYQSPSEDLLKQPSFKRKYRNYFDVVFFSPPYYKLEIYPGKNQSVKRYNNYELWLEKYWEATIQLCSYVIKSSGKMCYILSGYHKYENLNQDMNKIVLKYFKSNRKYTLLNTKFFNSNSEKIYIFSPKPIN